MDRVRINNVEVWRDAAALDEWRRQANAPDLDLEMLDMQMARYDAVDGGALFP